MAIDFIRSLFERSQAQGSRSTVLYPLGWAMTVLGAILIGLILSHADKWLVDCFAVATLVTLGCYLMAYAYFMVKQPDALRSEKFNLSKMAIERSITGDNLAGFVDPSVGVLPLSSSPTTPHKELQ